MKAILEVRIGALAALLLVLGLGCGRTVLDDQTLPAGAGGGAQAGAGTGGLAGGGPGSTPPPCGAQTCDTSLQLCCFLDPTAPFCADKNDPRACAGGLTLSCLDRSSCAPAEACCLSLTGASCATPAVCLAGNGAVVCLTSADCPAPAPICCPVFSQGSALCIPRNAFCAQPR